MSGGIDSTVVFVLLNQVLGQSRVKGVFINTGLLRPGDNEMVKAIFAEKDIQNFEIVDASKEFLGELENVSEPEKKTNDHRSIFS